MASQIDFTDATGAATLTNGKEAPFDRFAGWRSWKKGIGPSDVAAGTGRTFHWNFRNDQLAFFELPMIPMDSLDVVERLQYHLETGGEVTVTVGDEAEHVYVCVIAPGTEVEYEQTDAQELEYTLRLTLKNTAAAPLLCSW
jgi:hypothetical protein